MKRKAQAMLSTEGQHAFEQYALVLRQQAAFFCDLVEHHPGICFSAVLEAAPDLPVDVVWAELSLRRLFTDPSAEEGFGQRSFDACAKMPKKKGLFDAWA